MTERLIRQASWFYVLLVLIFLYGPTMVMILLAFNQSPLYELPFQFDLIWFGRLMGNSRLLRASLNSVTLALANAAISTILGVPAALALARRTFPGRAALQILLILPITIPWLILATAMLLFFFWTHIGRGFHAMLAGHVAVSIPYVILVMLARLQGMNPELEDAAASLGARPLQVFTRVTLPLLLPGVLAALMFAFIVSFDNFVISYFLAAPGYTTLPVEIYSAIRAGFTPEVNAVSALIFVISTVIVLAASHQVRFV